MRTIWQFFLIRLRLTVRQPGVLFFIFVPPLVLSTGLWFAFRSGDEQPTVRAAVYGDAGLAARLADQRSLQVEPVPSREEGEQHLHRGRVDALILAGPPVQVVLAEGRPEARLAELTVTDALERLEGRRPPASVAITRAQGNGTRYIDFLIPGLLGYTLLSSGLFGLGTLLVEMRLSRLLRRLKVTTMRLHSMLFGLMLGQMFQAVMELLVILAVAYLIFDVRCIGSLPLFLGFTLFSAVCFGGIALAVGSSMRTMEAFRGVDVLLMMPVALVSGVFFSAERFPAALQPFLKLLPSRAAVDGMRAVFTEGADASTLLAPGAILAAWGALCFAFAVRFFRWS